MPVRPKTATASLMIVLAVCAVTAFGCAQETPEAPKKAQVTDPMREALASVALSDGLRISERLAECNPEETASVVDEEFVATTSTAIPKIWDTCQAMYACSPAAKKLLRRLFADQSASFRLGFGDLRGLRVPRLLDKIGGLYLAGTENIYIDSSMKTPRTACHIILHEVIHKFDPNAKAGEESLRTEYRAYWYQTAFIAELYLDEGLLGLTMRWGGRETSGHAPGQMAFHTRKSLLSKIAEVYGFEEDLAILEDYPRLPFEKEVRVVRQ